MPTPIGHALAGVAVAWSAEIVSDKLANPRTGSTVSTVSTVSTGAPFRHWSSATLTAVCAVLAVLPDADLLYPPIHRTVTHSVGAIILVTIIAAAVTGWVTRRVHWRVALICGAAYGSHVLLDWLGYDRNPPLGIQALWPFSHQWFISGWDLFRQTERRQVLSWAAVRTNVEAIAQEVAILGPLAIGLWWARSRVGRSGKSGKSGKSGRAGGSGR